MDRICQIKYGSFNISMQHVSCLFKLTRALIYTCLLLPANRHIPTNVNWMQQRSKYRYVTHRTTPSNRQPQTAPLQATANHTPHHSKQPPTTHCTTPSYRQPHLNINFSRKKYFLNAFLLSFNYKFICCPDVIHTFTFLFVIYLIKIWDSSVSIVTRPQAGQLTYCHSNPRKDKILFSSPNVQTCSGAQPVGCGGSNPSVKEGSRMVNVHLLQGCC